MDTTKEPQWQRSSYCATNACVEVADGPDGTKLLRDSKNPGIVLTFTAGEWWAFAAGMRAGDFTPVHP